MAWSGGITSMQFGRQFGYYADTTAWPAGLILCGARWCDPYLGRWRSRDPIDYEGGANLYEYCAGDPVGAVDPEGSAPRKPGLDRGFCRALLKRIWEQFNELENTMYKNDPAADWKGNFPVDHGTGKLTSPNGHYLKILSLQAQFIANGALCMARCGGRGPFEPITIPDWFLRKPAVPRKGFTGPKFYPRPVMVAPGLSREAAMADGKGLIDDIGRLFALWAAGRGARVPLGLLGRSTSVARGAARAATMCDKGRALPAPAR